MEEQLFFDKMYSIKLKSDSLYYYLWSSLSFIHSCLRIQSLKTYGVLVAVIHLFPLAQCNLPSALESNTKYETGAQV